MQSSFLKLVAMAHLQQPKVSRKMFENHNERLYWLHKTAIEYLYEEINNSHIILEKTYKILKNCGNNNVNESRKGINLNANWLYSEVHSCIAKASIELKMATNQCNTLDVFLDNCALNQNVFSKESLNKDLDSVIDAVTKCLVNLQNSQIRLKKIESKLNPDKTKCEIKSEENVESTDNSNILQVEDKDPETKDEVFYFVKTEDDMGAIDPTADITTGPGKKERDNTKIVLGELKRKLVKREDVMRQREKIALEKTMPELKGQIPEFPRQIHIEHISFEPKGFINKIRKVKTTKKLKVFFKKTKSKKNKHKYVFRTRSFENEPPENLLTVIGLERKGQRSYKLTLTFLAKDRKYLLTKWFKNEFSEMDSNFGDSPGLSDVEVSCTNETVHQAVNINHVDNATRPRVASFNEAKNNKFKKEDLELTPSSESDTDFHQRKNQILKDIRRHRVVRKKKFPVRANREEREASIEITDEGLRPVEYSFGTGMALAAVFQSRNGMNLPSVGTEETFIGEGEVSEDSGNDEDA